MTDRVGIMTRIFGEMSDGRFADAGAYIHEDVVLELPYPPAGANSLLRGKAEFMEGFLKTEALFRSFVLTIIDTYDVPGRDTIIVEFTSNGVIDATNTPFYNRYIGVFQFRDDKVILWREYLNPELVNEQLKPLLLLLSESSS